MKIASLFALMLLCHFATAQEPTEHSLRIDKNVFPGDPFLKEKSYIIVNATSDVFPFKKGDIIKIQAESGLRHYRNKKLLAQYKTIPQLTIEKIQPQCRVAPCPPVEVDKLVYFIGSVEKFVNFKNNILYVSASQQKISNTPKKAIKIDWEQGYNLKLQ